MQVKQRVLFYPVNEGTPTLFERDVDVALDVQPAPGLRYRIGGLPPIPVSAMTLVEGGGVELELEAISETLTLGQDELLLAGFAAV